MGSEFPCKTKGTYIELTDNCRCSSSELSSTQGCSSRESDKRSVWCEGLAACMGFELSAGTY